MRTTTLTLLEASHVMVSSALLALLGVAASRIQAAPTWPIVLNPFAMHNSYTFTTHTGFFKYDTVDGASLPAVAANFGLHENTSWAELLQTLLELNVQGLVTDGSSYKLVFAGRHGQGYHNVAESQYGTEAWDSYWSKLTTDGKLVWGPDARLTPLGIQQAHAVNEAWVAMLKQPDHAPLPTKLFSSPLSRALSTLEISYDKLLVSNPNNTSSTSTSQPRAQVVQLQSLLSHLDQAQLPDGLEMHLKRLFGWIGSVPSELAAQLQSILSQRAHNQIPAGLGRLVQNIMSHYAPRPVPQVKELFREEYGEHTCDQRRTKSQIAADYPNAEFEAGFAQQDPLWTTTREQADHLDERIHQALTQMWNESPLDQVVSVTSHSGVMQSLFRVVGHYPIKPGTGALVPLIIKATPRR